MLFLRFILILFIIFAATFTYFKIILPLYKNIPIFPLFKKPITKLERELKNVNEKIEEVEMKKAIAVKKQKLNKKTK